MWSCEPMIYIYIKETKNEKKIVVDMRSDEVVMWTDDWSEPKKFPQRYWLNDS